MIACMQQAESYTASMYIGVTIRWHQSNALILYNQYLTRAIRTWLHIRTCACVMEFRGTQDPSGTLSMYGTGIDSNQRGRTRKWYQLNERPPSFNCLFFERPGPGPWREKMPASNPPETYTYMYTRSRSGGPIYGLYRQSYCHNFRDLGVKLHAQESVWEDRQ